MAINPIHFNKIRRFLYVDENAIRVMPGNQRREKEEAPKTYLTGQEYLIWAFAIITIFGLLYINSTGARRVLMDNNIVESFGRLWRNSLFGGASSNYEHFIGATLMILLTFGTFLLICFLLYKMIVSLLRNNQAYTMYVQTDQRLFIVERLRSRKLFKPSIRFTDYGPGDIFEPHLIDMEGIWRHVIFSDRIEPGGAARSDAMLAKRIGFYSINKAAEIYDDITLWMKRAQSSQVQIVHPELRFGLKLPQSWSIKRTSYPEEAMDYTTLDLVAARMHQEDYVRKITTSAAPWNTLLLTKRMPFEKEKVKNTVIYQTIIIEVLSTEDEDSLMSKFSEEIVRPFVGGEDLPGVPPLAKIVQRSILIGSFHSLLNPKQGFDAHSGAKKTDMKNGCSSLYIESEFKFGPHNFHLYQAYSTKDDLHFRFTLHSPSPIDDKTSEAFKEIIGSLHFFSPDEELPYPYFLQEKAKRRLTFRDN